MRFWVVFCFIVYHHFFSFQVYGQLNIYPKHFGQIAISKKLLNPAILNLNKDTSVLLGSRLNTGPFGKIYNYCLIGNLSLNKYDSASYVNSVGVKFSNEQDGQFIERPKFLLSYSIKRKLFSDYWLGLGVDFGRAWFVYNGTDISTAGSDSNWDGNLGLVMNNSTLTLACSYNQFFNSRVLPRDLYFRFRKFYTVFAEKKFNIRTSQLTIYGQNQFLNKEIDVLDIGAILKISDHFILGTNFWYKKNFSVIVGFEGIKIHEHQLAVSASYNTGSFNKTSTTVNSFELSLNYIFSKR